MDGTERHIGDILRERNIILKGADAASMMGFTKRLSGSSTASSR